VELPIKNRVASVFFFQAEDGIRDRNVTGVQTCALPISISVTTIRLFHIMPPARRRIILRSTKKRSSAQGAPWQPVCAVEQTSARSEERRVGKEWREQRGTEHGIHGQSTTLRT